MDSWHALAASEAAGCAQGWLVTVLKELSDCVILLLLLLELSQVQVADEVADCALLRAVCTKPLTCLDKGLPGAEQPTTMCRYRHILIHDTLEPRSVPGIFELQLETSAPGVADSILDFLPAMCWNTCQVVIKFTVQVMLFQSQPRFIQPENMCA